MLTIVRLHLGDDLLQFSINLQSTICSLRFISSINNLLDSQHSNILIWRKVYTEPVLGYIYPSCVNRQTMADDFNELVRNPRGSAVWVHFSLKRKLGSDEIVYSAAYCRYCNKAVQCGGGTTNLRVKRHHRSVLLD